MLPRRGRGKILRCKWAVAVVECIAQGHHRPNQIQHRLPGLTNKVLAARLAEAQRAQAN